MSHYILTQWEPLEDILENLEKGRRTSVVINVLNELRMRSKSIAIENLNILDTFVTNLEDPSDRAIALAMLAELMPSNGNESAKRAVESWRQEEDLKVSLSLGFQLVEILAKVDLDLATQIYQEVKVLFSRPGIPLAVGSLGDDFVSNVELAIRAVAGLPKNLIAENVEIIQGWISRLPAKRVQGDLYAKLASSLYRVDANKLANEIVRTNILTIIDKLVSSVDRRDLIHFSLPIIYKYDQAEADTLSNELLITQRESAWFYVILWTFANCYLGDLVGIKNPSQLKVSFNRPQLMGAITVAKKLQEDVTIYSAVKTITHVIQQSYSSERINPTQSLELLDELEKLIEYKLPDPKNIRHEGYLILAYSEIHRVRSILFIRKQARQLSRSDIGKKWQNLCDRASQIPNVADRVFVMSLVARNMSDYHDKDKSHIVAILEKAHEQIGSIPTLIDRLERLDTLAETWHKIGEKTKAQFAIEQGIILLNQFQGTSRDERLKAIVQTAYSIGDADLASEVISQLDKPKLPDGMLSTPQRTLQMEALRKQPIKVNEIINVTNLVHEREYILGLSANHLLEDLVTGRGKTDHPQTLGMWLHRSQDLHPVIIKDISSWVVENWVRGGRKKDISIFQEIIGLVVQMAESTFAVQRSAIPQTIENSFAGLSSKYVVFRPGETEKAQTWLRQWLTTNAKKYLKICDPYFGLEQLEYLSCVPENCLVFIVTTTKGGEMAQNNSESIKRHWQKISTRTMPFTRFTVVSAKSEHLFHDRVIISEGCGLDIGPSLNGLGKSQQKISMLSIEEASELDHKYLKDMLNSMVWLLEQGENPSVFSVGEYLHDKEI